MFTPYNAKPISLASAPWNEIHPEKQLFQSIPVVLLFHNFYNLRYAIPLGFNYFRISIFQKAPLIKP